MEASNAEILLVCFPDVDVTNHVINNIFLNGFEVGGYTAHEYHSFQWHIDTKYFTAQLSVCTCSHKLFREVDLDDCDRLEAVVVITDLNDNRTVEDVKQVLPRVADKDIEICLLYTCADLQQGGDVRDEVIGCCIDNQFELIENGEDEDDDDDDGESAFDDKVGVERVVEALKSHVWENKKMKFGPTTTMSSGPSPASGACASTSGLEVGDGDEEEDLSFHNLFGQFMAMKETAKTLGGEERKAYAEKVSLAFMDALGLHDSDDEDPIR